MAGVFRFKGLLPKAIVLAALVLAAVVSVQYVGGDSDPPAREFCDLPDGCDEAQFWVARSAEEELARKHAPIVFLPRTAGDCGVAAIRPAPVEMVLGNPEVALRKLSDTSYVKYGPTGADLYKEGGETYFDAYLDLPGSPLRPGCRYPLDAARFSDGLPSTAYARVVRQDDTLVLQYWLFYYFNLWNNKHEADWELIQLTFDATSAERALRKDPLTVALSQHSTGEVGKWTDAKVHREGGHPLVFVAAGSHANYFAPRMYVGAGNRGSGLGCDDASGSVERTPLDVMLLPTNVTFPQSQFAWLNYKGFWGEQAGPEYEGSSHPVTKQNWLKPLSWQKGLRSESQTVPLRETLGPNAIAAFCDMVSIGSDSVLLWYREKPMMMLAAFGVVSVGTLVGLTRTRYWPVRINPLRARRRLGQLLIASLEIYARYAHVFLGIGLLALPLGLLAPAVALPSIDVGLAGFLNPLHLEVQEAARILLQAELRFGLVYLALLWAATTVVARLERGQPPGALEAVADAARALPRLLAVRLLTIASIAVLTLTIVGVPVAVWLAVRWGFAEQAVLLERRSVFQALRSSARAVDADWWWSAGVTVCLGLAGMTAALAFGIAAFLFLKPVSLPYVNLATSIVFVTVVPYVAIALALAYFDLRTRST